MNWPITTELSTMMAPTDRSMPLVRMTSACAAATMPMIDTCSALDTAKSRDEYLAKTGKTVGALHGLPVSLKDNFNIKGLDSTVGFTSHVGEPATSDSTLVELLEEAGAVFFVKTNVPTAMMMAETVNNTFGRTVNPRNRQTTSGERLAR